MPCAAHHFNTSQCKHNSNAHSPSQSIEPNRAHCTKKAIRALINQRQAIIYLDMHAMCLDLKVIKEFDFIYFLYVFNKITLIKSPSFYTRISMRGSMGIHTTQLRPFSSMVNATKHHTLDEFFNWLKLSSVFHVKFQHQLQNLNQSLESDSSMKPDLGEVQP